MRKLLLGAVVAVAAMAIAAPTAFGALAPPYYDYDNDNWSKVVASDLNSGNVCEGPYWEDGCEVQSEADGDWSWASYNDIAGHCRDATLGYRISGNGATMRTETSWDDWHPWYGPFFCKYRVPVAQDDNETFWSQGAICAHEPTNTYWVLQYFKFEAAGTTWPGSIQGYSFGELTSSGHPGEVDRLTFGDPAKPASDLTGYATTTMTGMRHKVTFPFDEAIALYADDVPCGWGVLS